MNKKKANKIKIEKQMHKKRLLKAIKRKDMTEVNFLITQYEKKYGNIKRN